MKRSCRVPLISSVLGCILVAGVAAPIIAQDDAPARQRPRQRQQLQLADELSRAFSDVAETISPSVVSITSTVRVQAPQMIDPFEPFRDSPFRDFFGDDFFRRFRGPGGDGQGQPREFFQTGLGSGFVVSADGYILTNNHVVANAEEVAVVTTDERRFIAEVIGTDPQTDLAVLKIDASGLTPVTLGDSDVLRVGQWVVAAGTPFGLESTITAGIISATGRSRVGLAAYEDFIQTDAAINPGNSGGPLVNLDGEVVGVNTAIFSRSGGYMGIGFAIPINMAKSVIDSLIEDGRVVRGWLGVRVQDLTPGLARSFGYEGNEGALIGDVLPDTPASEAGLRPGDIVVAINGNDVAGADRLRFMIADIEPGETAEFRVFREGRTRNISVEIGEMQTGDVASTPRAEESEPELGMTVRTLTEDLAAQLGYEDPISGVIVTNVEPLSDAARAGLQVRDVITKVDNENVESAEQFRRIMRNRDLAEGVRLTVRSGEVQRFVFFEKRD